MQSHNTQDKTKKPDQQNEQRIKELHKQADEIITIVVQDQLKENRESQSKLEDMEKKIAQRSSYFVKQHPTKKPSCCEKFCSFFHKKPKTSLDEAMLAPSTYENPYGPYSTN